MSALIHSLDIRGLAMRGFRPPGGRLTTESGVGVSTSNRTAQGTLYYTPYISAYATVFNGVWRTLKFSELSLALTLTSGKNYDVFLNNSATALSLSAAWTNDTTRADALGTQDGVTVLNSDKTKLWLGTIRASGSNVIEDSLTSRFVWNTYNSVLRGLTKTDSTNHSYNTASGRYWNNDSTSIIAFVLGLPQQVIATLHVRYLSATGSLPITSIALDSGTTIGIENIASPLASSEISSDITSYHSAGIGYHFLATTEINYTTGGTFESYNLSAMLFL